MAIILDGKKLSTKILEELAHEVSKMDKKPSLVVIQVGDNPASSLYVGMKKKMAEKLGIKSEILKYSESLSEAELLEKIAELNSDSTVDAMLVQLPLPAHIDSKKILQSISPKKDVDGSTPENIGRISVGLEPFAYPCTPLGIMKLLEEYEIDIDGKNVVIVGRSNIVGKPLALMMLARNATVMVCHSKTKNLSQITKTADILVSAVGKNKIISEEMVKNKSVIVDVGVSKVDGKTVGDVDFVGVEKVCSFISPAIGGVGPMTIACLMLNTVELSKLSRDA